MKITNKFTFFCMMLFPVFVVGQKKKSSGQINQSKPNIIFILADDLGIGNVSCYGADNYQTPQIDKLAKEGMQFTHAYTAPLCGPSRALIMSGRYAFRTGASNQDATAKLQPEVETLMPSYMKANGYVTSCIGKWGQLPLQPSDFGFDDYIRFKGSGVYRSTEDKMHHYTVNGTDKILGKDEYMPDVMHQHLVDFIAKNKNQPFFVYYPMSHVHAKISPTPDSKPDSKDLFADNIRYMDKLVGKLAYALDSLKLRENTLIVFFGDNGTSNPWCLNSTVNGKKLSGKKGEMKECGSLVPMIANWPGKIKNGVVNPQLIDGSDFLSTFIELSGGKLPKDKVLDSRSFAHVISGKQGTAREWIFIQLGKSWYVRNDRWKLNNNAELFDMIDAPFEEKLIPSDSDDELAKNARNELQSVLDNLAPQNGILDTGTGNGRHANKEKKENKDKDVEQE
jgi:arylsulfatase A